MADKRESLYAHSENVSIIPKPSTVFGEDNLGEPLIAQRVVLDFTPMQELDNEFVQRKCCAFWKYIKSRNDLHHLLVLPDEELVPKTVEDTIDTHSELIPSKISKTALSVLECNEEQGLIDCVFEAKLQRSNCSLGPREYIEDEPTKAAPAKPKTCCCSKVCKLCRTVPNRGRGVPPSPEVQALCQKLQAWDTNHPKSMNPPGHAPALSHCIMQRKAIT